jgi:hypothetical protein
MSVAIQGVAFEFGKLFVSDNEVFYAKPGCFGSLTDVDLLADHKGNSFANTENDLLVHSGDEALIFRAYFSDEYFGKHVAEQTDELDSYLGVSTGFTITKAELIDCDGIPVKIILEAKLNEISLLNTAPVIDTTYARVVSDDTCGSLAEDYERIVTVGRYVNLHRKVLAADNDGIIEHKHVASSYDVAANRFVRALARLA